MIDLSRFEVMRGEEEWQRAGAYSVRIEGMNRQHNISLREEFDEHDCEGTRYIILLDDGYPVATCRFYDVTDATGLDQRVVTIGRVVVLPSYRGNHLGEYVIGQAEAWITELGYDRIDIESRTVAVDFYKKLGYRITDDAVIRSGVFECIQMSKKL